MVWLGWSNVACYINSTNFEKSQYICDWFPNILIIPLSSTHRLLLLAFPLVPTITACAAVSLSGHESRSILAKQIIYSHTALAANISISLAVMTAPKFNEKIAVKIPIVINRTTSNMITYKAASTAVERKDAWTRPTSDVRRKRPALE